MDPSLETNTYRCDHGTCVSVVVKLLVGEFDDDILLRDGYECSMYNHCTAVFDFTSNNRDAGTRL
jgi:hypothetical protein